MSRCGVGDAEEEREALHLGYCDVSVLLAPYTVDYVVQGSLQRRTRVELPQHEGFPRSPMFLNDGVRDFDAGFTGW